MIFIVSNVWCLLSNLSSKTQCDCPLTAKADVLRMKLVRIMMPFGSHNCLHLIPLKACLHRRTFEQKVQKFNLKKDVHSHREWTKS